MVNLLGNRIYSTLLEVARPLTAVMAAIHLCCVAALLLLPRSQGDRLLLDLGLKLERNSTVDKFEYGSKCDLHDWNHVLLNIDTYYFEHLFGWVIGGFMIRSAGNAFMFSLSWEVIEWEFMHVFRVFKECWWDKVFLDGLLGNLTGMILGTFLARSAGLTKFVWFTSDRLPRTLAFHAVNQAMFCLGSFSVYAFNDAIDMYEFHPLTFVFVFGSFLLVFTANHEQYEHFSGQRVRFVWRALCLSCAVAMMSAAWKYGLCDYTWVMPDNWILVLAVTLLTYLLIFFANYAFRTFPTYEQLKKQVREANEQERQLRAGKPKDQ